MRFKSLTMQGFKSFVDKTTISFPGGITCVVGPNGSGKSNILDAVRWVFGEQSVKELRGSDMEDIIFSGSGKRKSSGYGEVSLTLDEIPESVASKWGTMSEVTVTRKYYRTGEREYKINNRKCRLKDIKEIFYDTGIGAKSISIIEQGKVDKIVGATPEELRHFFEETAGVVRFKERKKEAERRLSQTKDNLSRVNDIISEIKAQIETLEKQVEVVKRYKDYHARQSALSRKIIFHKYDRLKNEASGINAELNDLKVQLSSKISEFEKVTAEETRLENEIASLREEYRTLNSSTLETQDKIGKTEADIKLLENEIDSAESTKSRLHHSIEDMEKKLREISDKRVEVLSEKEKIQTEKDKLTERLEELNERMGELEHIRDQVNDEILELDSEYIDLMDNQSNIRNLIFESEATLTRFEKDEERLKNEAGEIDSEISEASAYKKDTGLELERLERELEAVSEKLESVRDELEEKKQETEAARADLEAARRRKSQLEDKISMLESRLDEEAGGEGAGGLISELGGELLVNTVNIDDEKTAEMAGDIIVFDADGKDNVLNRLNEFSGSMRFTFSDRTAPLVEELSAGERVTEFIVKSGEIYRKIGKDDRGVTIVRLKNELSKAMTDAELAASSVAELEEKFSKYSDMQERLADEAEVLTDKSGDLKVDVSSAKHMHTEAENQEERLIRRKEIVEKEIEQIKVEFKKTEDALGTHKEKSKANASQIAELEDQKSILEERADETLTMYEDVRDEIGSLKVEERGFSEQINTVVKELHFIDRDMGETTSRLSSSKERLSSLLTVDIVNFKDRLGAKKDELAVLYKKQTEQKDKLGKTDSRIGEIEKQLADFKKNIEDSNRKVRDAEAAISEKEIRKSRINGDIENISENYYEKFEEEIADASLDLTDFQPNKAKTELDVLNREIDSLGPLNMAAEKEYDEILKRHEFLTGQRADLEDAIASIQELIREIDDSTVMLFKDTFEGVKKNFEKVFRILFGEGECDLRLTDENNMLESGIEIFAQPPGKSLKNMSLLSGGEKALSACTLLFALFLYRPTPFCFLDEIDAPLDDSNIGKFIKVVRTLSGDTQFVIITHSQLTMAAADSLYGITMQEPGVSKILSVKLERSVG